MSSMFVFNRPKIQKKINEFYINNYNYLCESVYGEYEHEWLFGLFANTASVIASLENGSPILELKDYWGDIENIIKNFEKETANYNRTSGYKFLQSLVQEISDNKDVFKKNKISPDEYFIRKILIFYVSNFYMEEKKEKLLFSVASVNLKNIVSFLFSVAYYPVYQDNDNLFLKILSDRFSRTLAGNLFLLHMLETNRVQYGHLPLIQIPDKKKLISKIVINFLTSTKDAHNKILNPKGSLLGEIEYLKSNQDVGKTYDSILPMSEIIGNMLFLLRTGAIPDWSTELSSKNMEPNVHNGIISKLPFLDENVKNFWEKTIAEDPKVAIQYSSFFLEETWSEAKKSNNLQNPEHADLAERNIFEKTLANFKQNLPTMQEEVLAGFLQLIFGYISLRLLKQDFEVDIEENFLLGISGIFDMYKSGIKGTDMENNFITLFLERICYSSEVPARVLINATIAGLKKLQSRTKDPKKLSLYKDSIKVFSKKMIDEFERILIDNRPFDPDGYLEKICFRYFARKYDQAGNLRNKFVVSISSGNKDNTNQQSSTNRAVSLSEIVPPKFLYEGGIIGGNLVKVLEEELLPESIDRYGFLSGGYSFFEKQLPSFVFVGNIFSEDIKPRLLEIENNLASKGVRFLQDKIEKGERGFGVGGLNDLSKVPYLNYFVLVRNIFTNYSSGSAARAFNNTLAGHVHIAQLGALDSGIAQQLTECLNQLPALKEEYENVIREISGKTSINEQKKRKEKIRSAILRKIISLKEGVK